MAGILLATESLYSGKPGIHQEEFFRQARDGWVDLQEDTQRHLTRGQTQYEYLKKVGCLTSGQAKRLLNDFVDSWNPKDLNNEFLEEAVSREAIRDVWRKYYRLRAIHDMKCTRIAKPGRAPVAPNLRPDPIEEPEELEEFLQLVVETFQSSQAAYLDDLRKFTALPDEGLLDLATRFDNLAIPLLNAHLTTERDLALVLRKHIPVFLRKKTYAKMEAQDDKRRIRGEDPSTRQEMIAIAREVEMNIIAYEAESN